MLLSARIKPLPFEQVEAVGEPYQFNLDGYPAFQQYFRDRKPPTLIVRGKNDTIFGPAGAEALLRDLPDAELHLLDTGHFALEEDLDTIASLMRDFLGRVLA